jgi:hypothetical protein
MDAEEEFALPRADTPARQGVAATVLDGAAVLDGTSELLGTAELAGELGGALETGASVGLLSAGAAGATALLPALLDPAVADPLALALALAATGRRIATIRFSKSAIRALISAKVSPLRWWLNRTILRQSAVSCASTSSVGMFGTLNTNWTASASVTHLMQL